MGSHTWCYCKVSAVPKDVQEGLIKAEIENCEKAWFYTAPKERVIEELSKVIHGYSEETYNKEIEDRKNYIRDLKTPLGFKVYFEHEKKKNTARTIKYKGADYILIKFDYPFRVCGYPENKFRSRKALLRWLESYSTTEVIGFYTKDDHNKWKFIEGYTGELVSRINTCYKEYGERNLLFTFG